MANDLGTTVGDMKAALRQVLPTIPHQMGVLAVQFTMERFRAMNWVDSTTKPWAKRKSQKDNAGRGLLIKSGRLKRSIRVTEKSGGTVVIGTDVPYAKVHNEGSQEKVLVGHHLRHIEKAGPVALTKKGKPKKRQPKPSITKIEVKAHFRKNNIPQRQFIGNSAVLTTQLQRMMAANIMKALKK
jgi:phage gpG-like protein